MTRAKEILRALWIVLCLPLCGLLIWGLGGIGALVAACLFAFWLTVTFKPGWLPYVGIAAIIGGIVLFPPVWNQLNSKANAPLSTYYAPPARDNALYEYYVSSGATETIWRTKEDHLVQWTPEQKDLFTGSFIDGVDRLRGSIGLALVGTGILAILVYAAKDTRRTAFKPFHRLIGRGGAE